MQRLVLVLAAMAAGCNLYWDDGGGRTGRHGSGGGTEPDAGISYLPDAFILDGQFDGGGCCGSPDAGGIHDAGGYLPDAAGYLPDAAIVPPDACNGP